MNKEKIKSQIRKLSKERGVDAQILLGIYMLERFLERISASRYNSMFILKGGLLIASLIGVDARSTMDIDATIRNYKLDKERTRELIKDVISAEIDDGVEMFLRNIETIRNEADYYGLRIIIDCSLDGLKQVLKVDLTTGDVMTPGPIEYQYDLLLEERAIDIYTYNIETVLAEKIETIITRSLANTRMRDYYDVFMLMNMQSNEINIEKLKHALESTAKSRATVKNFEKVDEVLTILNNSTDLQTRWRKYQNSYDYAKGITFEMIINSLKKILYF